METHGGKELRWAFSETSLWDTHTRTLPELSTIKQKRGVFLSHDGRDTDSRDRLDTQTAIHRALSHDCAPCLWGKGAVERTAGTRAPSPPAFDAFTSLRRTMGENRNPRKISPTYLDWPQSGIAAWRFCDLSGEYAGVYPLQVRHSP